MVLSALLWSCGTEAPVPAPTCTGDITLIDGTNRAVVALSGVTTTDLTIESVGALFSPPVPDTLSLTMSGGDGDLPWLPYDATVDLTVTAQQDDGTTCTLHRTLQTPSLPTGDGAIPHLAVGRGGGGLSGSGRDGGYALLTYTSPVQLYDSGTSNAVAVVRVRTGEVVGLFWFTPDALPPDLEFITEAHAQTREAFGPIDVIDAVYDSGQILLLTQGVPPDPEHGGLSRASHLLAIEATGAAVGAWAWARTLPETAHHNFALADGQLYYPTYLVRSPYTATCGTLITSPGIRRHTLESGADALIFSGEVLLKDPGVMASFVDEADCEMFCNSAENKECPVRLSHGGMIDYLNAIGIDDGVLWGTVGGSRQAVFTVPLSGEDALAAGDCSALSALTNPGADLWADDCQVTPVDTDVSSFPLSHPHYFGEDGWVLDLNRVAMTDNPDSVLSLTRFADDGTFADRVLLAGWDSSRHSSLRRLQGEGGWLVVVSDRGCLVVLDDLMEPFQSLCPDAGAGNLDTLGWMRLRWGRTLSAETLWEDQGWQLR